MRCSRAALAWKNATDCAKPSQRNFSSRLITTATPGVLVRLSQVDLEEGTEIVTESWRLCAPKRLLAAYDAEHPLPA